ALRGLPREKVLATVVHLLETTLIRVGNDDYAKENNSYGLTTLKNRHVAVEGNEVHFRFSNRPVGVKHFQTIRRCSVDVAHGLVLLFGIGTKALPSWDSKTRWSNLLVGLAGRQTAGPGGHANSPHPSSREGHHSTAGWSSSYSLCIMLRCHAVVTASLVQRNSV